MKVGASKGMNKSKEGEGSPMKRRYLPLELRMKLYEEALKLRKKGLSCPKIAEEIYKRHRVRLYRATINRWIKGRMQPLGKVNKFNDKPTPELSYIIGAILGDGCKCHYERNYTLALKVKDKEFAETFAENLTKVLLKKKPYKPFYSSKTKYWIVMGYSKFLYDFLNKPLKELMMYIEYSRECITSFLRALFDGEGCIYEKTLILSNTDKKLLDCASYLLKKYFNIDTSLYFSEKAGKIYRFPNGKIYKATKDQYELYIHADGLMSFYNFIGFAIKRKQQRLIEAIKNQK